MKYLNYLQILLISIIILSSCEKEEVKQNPVGSLKIVNSVSGGSPVRFGGVPTVVNNNASVDFAVYAGNPDIFVWPVGDSAAPYYHAAKSVDFNDRDMYTLFLGGDTNAVEAIFVKEDFPVRIDSTAGIRIINLSPNSPAIRVTLSTSAGTSEFGDIAYKKITAFQSYSALHANTEYVFEFRDVATDALITSFTVGGATLTDFVPRFRNITLVLRDVIGGTPAAGVTRVNHY